MIYIIGGYVLLVAAWVNHGRRNRFWYWWSISWALINFGVATYNNL